MKLIELHILQSFPVSCLNRDDVGSPKSAIFGGVPRARISSQSLKRAIRMHAKDLAPEGQFEGIRTRRLKELFVAALEAKGVDEVEKRADELCLVLSSADKKNPDQVTTAVYLSPGEIEEIASALADGKTAKQAVKGATRKDAADIALFGRMIANDSTLNVDGAAMFSHALSTHKVSNEVDFFSAVDDMKTDAEDAGAGMIGTLEFNSALYYRYAALNVDLLADNLGNPDGETLKNIVIHFIKATLEAVPGARKNSMNANTRPSYVLGTVKLNGQPVQLVNAFENPVWSPGKGFTETSIEKLTGQHTLLANTWGVTCDAESSIPQDDLATFISTLTDHVS
ncbi:MAG: type I-E CRISPR-associated protein Cas7/Cse4/CasC [Akkermansiaceae bacterium]|nr:type I-E CRISPR-associated protein Cas7/Cse4/CasC [Akkermansiaceae bacterium]